MCQPLCYPGYKQFWIATGCEWYICIEVLLPVLVLSPGTKSCEKLNTRRRPVPTLNETQSIRCSKICSIW